MANFKSQETTQQAKFKQTSSYFSQIAKPDGIYRKKPRDFCLPQNVSEENLYSEFRDSAIGYFKNAGISWHQGIKGKPTNHLCSSQVCCVNFLYAFVDQPTALADLLRPLYPDLKKMLVMDRPNHSVEFEWIGAKNYLNEKVRGKRTRGANVTSTDAAVMFECNDGKKHIVLFEWKYTESYSRTFIKFAKSGTDRSAIYYPLYQQSDFPLDKSRLPHFDDLFYEPFYQFMRQQLLANEMQKAHELGADMVSVLHICPSNNHKFQRVTSPKLKQFGTEAVDVWKSLLVDPTKFIHISTEDLFLPSITEKHPVLNQWWKYIIERYQWMQ